MEEVLNVLDITGEMKIDEVYSLLKTNSKKINSEISKKIKSFKKIDDFLNHYSNKTSLFELLNKVEFNSSKNYDELFSSFDSNVEKYISCFTQIIISIKLILETQEILKKIFLTSKQYLSKLKIEQQIENISEENLIFFIKNLLNISRTESPRNYLDSTSILRFESSDSKSSNSLYSQNFINDQILKPSSSIVIGKTLKLLYEEPCSTSFDLNPDSSIKNIENQNYQNINIKKESSLILSGEQNINSVNDDKDIIMDERNDYIENKIVYNNSMNAKKYENLLEMINNIYKKCIINSEEKIGLKQLVIAKSKKIESLYYNNYRNKFIDENALRSEITKLLNEINVV